MAGLMDVFSLARVCYSLRGGALCSLTAGPAAEIKEGRVGAQEKLTADSPLSKDDKLLAHD